MDGRFMVGHEISEALIAQRAVVALETSVLGQGLPHPNNVACFERMDEAVRQEGAVPAWIGVVDGAVRVGLTRDEIGRLVEPGGVVSKAARRDLPAAVANGSLGATTVSATIWAAAKAGIVVSATGGIGGVHPGEVADVSADLRELARTPGMLVCSGPKSIIDAVATAERLDELGVALIGYRTDRLASFFVREAPVELEHRIDTPEQAASTLHAALDLGTRSTLVLCNPVPEAHAMDPLEVDEATAEAERRAADADVRGTSRTPFLLAALAEITQGRSLEANLALLECNAGVAAQVAAAV